MSDSYYSRKTERAEETLEFAVGFFIVFAVLYYALQIIRWAL